MDFKQLLSYLLVAVSIEGIITYIDTWIVDKNFQWQQLVSMIIGIFIAVVYHMDYLAEFGVIASLPHVGEVITGFAFSRGSNYVCDLFRKLMNIIKNGIDYVTEAEGENEKG